jgi:hypothetical protein
MNSFVGSSVILVFQINLSVTTVSNNALETRYSAEKLLASNPRIVGQKAQPEYWEDQLCRSYESVFAP